MGLDGLAGAQMDELAPRPGGWRAQHIAGGWGAEVQDRVLMVG